MQATITYMLTEQAQRAQMVATGQPVPRKQTDTVEVALEDLDCWPIAADGSIRVDLTAGYYPSAGINSKGTDFAAAPDFPALVRAERARDAEAKKKKRAELETELADQIAACQRFLANPALRSRPGSDWTIIDGTRVQRTDTQYHLGCPLWGEVLAEVERRTEIDAAAAAAAAEIKKAADSAREVAKSEYVADWIIHHTDDLTRRQQADGLLSRSGALAIIAASVFDPIAEKYNPAICDDSSCPCGRNDIDSLPTSVYPRWLQIKSKLPGGSTVEFERVRECLRDAAGFVEEGDGAAVASYAAVLKVPVGPFTLERRVRI